MATERPARRAPVLSSLFHRHATAPRPAALERRVLILPRGDVTWSYRAGAHHHARTRHGIVYLLVLFVLWLLNAADLALTLHWTSAAGWRAEGNGWMRALAETTGPAGFVLYKLVLMTAVVVVLWWLFLQVEDALALARRPVPRFLARCGYGCVHLVTLTLVAFYSWVLWNNLRIAGLA